MKKPKAKISKTHQFWHKFGVLFFFSLLALLPLAISHRQDIFTGIVTGLFAQRFIELIGEAIAEVFV